jgi:hypothetical protein
MSDRPALVAGTDGRMGFLRLAVPTNVRLDVRPVGMVIGANAPEMDMTATPPYVRGPNAGTIILGRIEPPAVFLSPGFDLKWTLQAASLVYRRTAAGDTLEFFVYRAPRSGFASAGSLIYSVTSGGGGFTTTAAWAAHNETMGSPVDLDFSVYSYSYLWKLTPLTTGADVKVGTGCYLSAEAKAVI